MTYAFIGFNNCYLPKMGFGGLFGCFRPVVSYSFYNPFPVFNILPALFDTSWMMPSNSSVFSSYNYSFPSLTVPYSAPSTFDSLNNGWNLYSFNNYSNDSNNIFESITAKYDFDENSIPAQTVNRRPAISSVYPDSRPIYSTFYRGYLNKEFLNKVKQVAQNINCDYEDLLALMNSESSLNPSATHKNSSGEKTAAGLIQFTKNAAIPELNRRYGLNLTIEKIENMSATEQLDLVEKYYRMHENQLPKGRKLTAADLYALTFLPARAKRDVLTSRGEDYYDSNKGLDMNDDGYITKSDLNARLARKRVNLDTFA